MIDRAVFDLAYQARQAWIDSGESLTGTELGAMYDRSPRWGRERIREARNWREESIREVDWRDETTQDIKQVGGTHYHDMPMSPFEIIDAFGLDFYTGNVLKYLLRAGRKPGVSRLQDLEKAHHYLEEVLQREKEGTSK